MLKLLVLILLFSSNALSQEHYQSCGQDLLLPKAPQRALSMDINTTEIMLTLGLAPRMVAIAGVSSRKDVLPSLLPAFDRIPKIDASYPGLDPIVGKKPDFVFAGWQYGFSEASGLTPQRLAKFGIASYALTESCIRIQPRSRVSLEDVFTDVETIARIFGEKAQADRLIDGWRQKIAALPKRRAGAEPHRIFLYDSGESMPFTAGRFAIPQAMIEAAGGQNIFADVKSSWTSVSWESVIARRPEFVIIVDYGDKTAEEKVRFLTAKFKKASLDAMERQRFIVLPYAAVTPGIRTVDTTAILAKVLQRHFSPAG